MTYIRLPTGGCQLARERESQKHPKDCYLLPTVPEVPRAPKVLRVDEHQYSSLICQTNGQCRSDNTTLSSMYIVRKIMESQAHIILISEYIITYRTQSNQYHTTIIQAFVTPLHKVGSPGKPRFHKDVQNLRPTVTKQTKGPIFGESSRGSNPGHLLQPARR